jgi:predicted  nucleic acid-binding Zn-ribbon protein
MDSTIVLLTQGLKGLELQVENSSKPFEDALSQLEVKKQYHETLLKQRREKEANLDDRQVRIDRMRERTSDIKTNKEYLAHLKEIEAAETEKSHDEERVIVLMEETDNLVQTISTEEDKVAQLETDLKKEKEKIEKEKGIFLKKIDFYKKKRDELARSLSRSDYAIYTSLYKTRGGKAVVETKNEVCLGCHLNIPPQLFNDIKKNEDIITCSYCKRILYYKDDTMHSEEK